MQNLSVFPKLFYVFGGVTYFVLCGTYNALLTSAIIILFSHNIIASLCCWSVDYFTFIIAIMRYDCKPILNTIVRKLYVVGIVNHELTYEFAHHKSPPSQSPPTSCSSAPCIFDYHFESSDDICKMHV